LEKLDETRLQDALICFNKTLEIDDSYAPAYNARGLVLDKIHNYE